jgi:hypothetical protein
MTVSNLETYFHEENYKFLIVQVFHKECYGFDLGNTEEHATARQIILEKNNFIYTGWKVARKLANWIRNNDEWTEFLNEKKSVENHDNDVLVNDIVRPTKVGNAINDGNWIPSKPTYSLKSLRHS